MGGKNRLNVLQVISELAPAGAEKVVLSLAAGLAARGHRVAVSSLFDPRGVEADVGDLLAGRAVAVHRLKMRCKADLLRLAGLVTLIRRLQPDLIHTHLWHADLAGRVGAVLAWPGRPVVVSTVHIAERRPVGWRFAIDRLTKQLVDRTVFVSRSVMDFYCRRVGLATGVCEVIPNGIDVASFRDGVGRDAAKGAWVGPCGAWVVGSVARLDRQKGLDVLLRAFGRLSGRWGHAVLVVAGSGPEESRLRALAQELGIEDRVKLIGFQQDVRSVLGAMDVFVLPSRWEGFGLATLEAMAAGLAVVVTDVPGSRDLVQHERTGLVVRPGDVEGLADAIERCLADRELASRLGREAQRVAEGFGIEQMVDRYERMYQRLVRVGRVGAEIRPSWPG